MGSVEMGEVEGFKIEECGLGGGLEDVRDEDDDVAV
jgi:hypothetical protein